MIVLKRQVLDNYLKATHRNYSWLAREMDYTKGYISQVINDDRYKISSSFIEKMLMITNIPFNELFYMDGRPEWKQFYDEVFEHEKKPVSKKNWFARKRADSYAQNY